MKESQGKLWRMLKQGLGASYHRQVLLEAPGSSLQGKLETSQCVSATRGGLAINYRREFKSEKRTHVSENYLGKNPCPELNGDVFNVSSRLKEVWLMGLILERELL